MEKLEQGLRRRLVLVPGPFQGHLTPMLQLGTILHSRGFAITIIHTQFNFPDPRAHPEFEFLCVEEDGLTKDASQSGDLISLVLTLNINCESTFQQRLAQKSGICCIIYDGLMYFSEAVARRLAVPCMILHTNSVASSLARSFLLILKAQGYIPLKGPSARTSPLRFKDLPISNFGNLEDHLQLITLGSDIRTSSAIIWNTVDCLEDSHLTELKHQYQVPIFPIGPIHRFAPAAACTGLFEEDCNCIPWLNKQSPSSVLYISLGSIASINDKQLAEMAHGLANSKQRFLWVVRENSVQDYTTCIHSLGQELGEMGRIVKWAPQKRVLAHKAVGGFWSHCGWNSTMESICEGVPMICQPCFGDQKVNARYLTGVWKVGVEMEGANIERGRVERAVRALMFGKEGEEMKERMMVLKRIVERSVEKGGSSHSSLEKLIQMLEMK